MNLQCLILLDEFRIDFRIWCTKLVCVGLVCAGSGKFAIVLCPKAVNVVAILLEYVMGMHASVHVRSTNAGNAQRVHLVPSSLVVFLFVFFLSFFFFI